jgi:hypothetical protein
VETTTIDRMPREFVRGRHGNLRVIVRSTPEFPSHSAELDRFIERTRADVFALYAAVREPQRESSLPVSQRLRMLGSAAEQAARISRAIDAFAATLSTEDDRGFGVPI